MGKRNHVTDFIQRVVPKKHRKKVLKTVKKSGEKGKRQLNNGIDRVLYGKKGRRR